MTRIENSVEINASPDKVWQYIWDLNNLPNYMPIGDVEIKEATDDFIKVCHMSLRRVAPQDVAQQECHNSCSFPSTLSGSGGHSQRWGLHPGPPQRPPAAREPVGYRPLHVAGRRPRGGG